MEKQLYDAYVSILKEELVPAMGCTEPIALAYTGALARKALSTIPESVQVMERRSIRRVVKWKPYQKTAKCKRLERRFFGEKIFRNAVAAGAEMILPL